MTNKNKTEVLAVYRLKSMVMARILAELTVCIILITLPLVAMGVGQFSNLPVTWQVVSGLLSLISALFLPAYGFITWKVTVTDNALIARSILQKKELPFANIKSINRRSNWNWQRYVVESEDSNLSFPIWLLNVEELVKTIKSRLPGGGAKSNPFQRFTQDPISLTFQFIQASFGVVLAVFFWLFFSEQWTKHSTNQTDLYILLAFCLILTACILWRTVIILLMPKRIQITPPSLIVDTLFFSKEYAWEDVKKVDNSTPLLPEGFMIKTKSQSYLIGPGMDAADELISSIKKNIPNKIETT